jgi:hypothetical protein
VRDKSTYPWAVFRNGRAEGLHNTSIDVEQIVTSHSRFAWYSSWDDNQVTSLQGLSQISLSSITFHLHITFFSATITNKNLKNNKAIRPENPHLK